MVELAKRADSFGISDSEAIYINMNGYIYKIENLINGKIYIGQTVQSVNKRWSEHCNNKSCCKVLKNAIAKYGKENFKITILNTVVGNNKSDIKIILNTIEEQLITNNNSLVPNRYNILKGGQSSSGRRWKTPPMLGKKQSEDAKRKVSEANMGLKRPWMLSHMSKIHEKCKKPIRCLETGQVWGSVKECAEFFNVKPKQVSRVLKGQRKRLKWAYTLVYEIQQS